jgi:hypothetical protein
LTIIFGTSRETSDFLVDGLQQWWTLSKDRYQHIRQLVIDLDNGPQNASFRTQFMKRMVEFADHNHLEIVLVYYPPYHSKYNPIERCWGILEEHWNGTLLDRVDTVLHWARTMTWKVVRPLVQLLDKAYANGVRVAKKAFQKIEDLQQREVGFKVLTGQGAQIDTTTANGRLILGIFAALAEFEAELIRERTRAGLAAARARGRHGGRPRKMTPAALRMVMAALADRTTNVTEVA